MTNIDKMVMLPFVWEPEMKAKFYPKFDETDED
jgi:hypothetical protein